MSNKNGKRNFFKQLVPAFVLEYKYFNNLRNITDVAIYAQIEKMHCAGLPPHHDDMNSFCLKMQISEKDFHDSCMYLMELGLLMDEE